MKVFSKLRWLYIIFISFFFSSCSSDLDFSQTKNLKLSPVVVANMVYFDIPANEFVTNGIETPQYIDQSTVDIFKNSLFVNDLNKIDMDFEITNTISRSFTMQVKFYDSSSNLLDTILISVPAYLGFPNKITQTELFQTTRLNILKNTTKMQISLKMNAGTTLTETSSGSIKLRSALTAYFVIQ